MSASEIATTGGDTFLQDTLAIINKRFPLLSAIRIGTRTELAPIPAFIGLIAAIVESAKNPCCVVLPDTTGVALGTAVLTATTALQRNVANLLRAFADNCLTVGDRVLVHPSGFIYEYGGFFTPQHFRLKVIDRNESRSLPVGDVARLEKSIRKRPKGHLNSNLGSPRATVLGTLIGIPGTVNRNFMRNHVLILGQKKDFLDLSESWTVGVTDSNPVLIGTLAQEIPLGEISEEGCLQFFDQYVASGEPPIAIASRPEDLAARCAQIPRHSCAVLVNDVERLARNLQAFDAIADTQIVVIIAEEAQHEHVRILRDRGCDVWRFSSEEVLLGIQDPRSATALRTALRKATNMRDLVISSTPCSEPALDEAVADLLACANTVPKDHDIEPARELFIRLFSIVMACAEHLGAGSDALLTEVKPRLDQAALL